MARTWTYVVEQRGVEQMVAFSRDDRQRVLTYLKNLRDAPDQPSHAELPDINGRRVRLKRMGIFVITYWDVHPVKELRIVSIERR